MGRVIHSRVNLGARTYWLLLLAFGALLLCLVGSAAYSVLRANELGRSAEHLAQASAPAAATLIDLRGELRRLELLVEATPLIPAPEAERRLAESRSQLRRHLARYLELPHASEDESGRVELRDSLQSLDRGLGTSTDRPDQRRGRLVPLIERADLAAGQMSSLDAALTVAQASLLEERLHVFSHRALMLDLFSLFVTLAAGIGSIWAVRRFTRLRETNAQLLQERADELEQFAGRVAHDILSPLNVVSLSIELATRAKAFEDARARLERGLSSLQRVKRIVNGLLSFARAGAHPDPTVLTDVKGVLTDVVSGHKPIAAELNVGLVLEPLTPTAVLCETGVLTSAVSNLVHNAIKYVGRGDDRWVKVRARDLPDTVRIEVEDNGPGLSPELARRAFEPYVRGPQAHTEPGIGLGLATVRRIAEAHRGQVGVDRAPGGGSLFWFELPKEPAPGRGRAAPAPSGFRLQAPPP